MGNTVHAAAPGSPLRVVSCRVRLDRTDREKMRPGMRFHGVIETERYANAVVVPLEAVFPRTDGPVAYRRFLTALQKVPLELGRRNQDFAEVIDGLSEADRVSRRPPEGEE